MKNLVMLMACSIVQHAVANESSLMPILQPACGDAERLIVQVFHSDDEYLRANAIEAMQVVPERLLPMVQLGLKDPSPVVRFTALMLIGKCTLAELGNEAVEFLSDRSPSVRAAALFAVRACGRDTDLRELPTLLVDKSSTVRRNTAMVIGLMGEKSAIHMLRDLSRVSMHTVHPVEQMINRLQIAEAILLLGDDKELDTVRAGAYSRSVEVRVLAITILGNVKDLAMIEAFPPMLQDETIEVRLAAATTLAKLGRDDGLDVILEGANFDAEDVKNSVLAFLGKVAEGPSVAAFRRLVGDPSEQHRVAAMIRAQAAFGLGQVYSIHAAERLVQMLAEDELPVTLAAAASILKAVATGSRATQR